MKKNFFEVCKSGTPDEVRAATSIQEGKSIRDSQVAKSSDEFTAGQTGLMIAAQFNPDPKVLQILLDNWSDREAKDDFGMNALMYAAHSNPNPEIVDKLLMFGTRNYLNAVDNMGANAAIHAIYNPNIEVTKKVLASGIDMTGKTSSGKRPLEFLQIATPYTDFPDPELLKLYQDATHAQCLPKEKFKVQIKEILTDTYEIEASNKQEAIEKAKGMYENNEIGPTIETSAPYPDFIAFDVMDKDSLFRSDLLAKIIEDNVTQEDMEEAHNRIMQNISNRRHPIREEAHAIMESLESHHVNDEKATQMAKLLHQSKDYEKQLEKALERAKDTAAEIVPRQNVHEALDSKSYKGTVVDNRQTIILLQTRKDEIVLIPEEKLAKIPEYRDKVEIKRAKDGDSLRDVSLIERDIKGR